MSSIFATKGFAQDYGNKVDPLKLCIAIQANNFISDAEAENALDRILSVIGASKRFVLQPCDNIDNAVAVSYKGVRYILYDKEFMNSVSSGNNWSNLFILAHEVGHHINGHSLDLVLYATQTVEAATLASRRQQELEADEFAGFILGKLGASLPQTSQAINLLATDGDDTYSSHPSKSKRLEAISSGFSKSKNDENRIVKSSRIELAAEYFYQALDKAQTEDYNGAIAAFSKSIDLDPNDVSYHNRAIIKNKINDHMGAIVDYNKAIQLNPKNSDAYYGRGVSKNKLKENLGAISDFLKFIELNQKDANQIDYVAQAYFGIGTAKAGLNDFEGAIGAYTKSIEFDSKFADAYFNRGNSRVSINDYNGSIEDYSYAIKLAPKFVSSYINRGLSKVELKDFDGAIIDFTKVIQLDSNNAEVYYFRGASKIQSIDFQFGMVPTAESLEVLNDVISDLSKSFDLKPNYQNAWKAYQLRGMINIHIRDFYGAVSDYTNVIRLVSNNAEAYYFRGVAKVFLKDNLGACNDGRKAKELGNAWAEDLIKNTCF